MFYFMSKMCSQTIAQEDCPKSFVKIFFDFLHMINRQCFY